MANYIIQDTELIAIADAIRTKNGSADTYTTAEMVDAIAAIETGGGGVQVEELTITANGTYTAPEGVGYSPVVVNVPQDGAPPASAFSITGNCQYKFAGSGWNWFIDMYGNQVTTSKISNCANMFYENGTLVNIPFDININNKVDCNNMFRSSHSLKNIPKINGVIGDIGYMFYECGALKECNYNYECDNSTYYKAQYVFYNCRSLTKLPYFINLYPSDLGSFFAGCYSLKTIPEDYMDTWNFNRLYTYNYSNMTSIFQSCYGLRSVPVKILSKLHHDLQTSAYSKMYYQMFYSCYSLDEIIGLAVDGATLTTNSFQSTFGTCTRLKNFTFETNEDGTPKTAKWKSQTIDLNGTIGFTGSFDTSFDMIKIYSPEITEDKWITDDTSYQALKDDSDSLVIGQDYSRYNHDSAVATINSLPDTSAYLASAGGTNTIKFKGAAGAKTDGGAINTLTEEEIAVATAKGWTVTLV